MTAFTENDRPGQFDYIDKRNYTCGDYATEADAHRHLAQLLDAVGLFTVHHELTGLYVHTREADGEARPRIDYVLEPTETTLAAGWTHGNIGIEVKRSGEKVGKPLSQMIDYRRAGYKTRAGRFIVLDYVCLYPWEGALGGPLLSIETQQHLGHAYVNPLGHLIVANGKNIILATKGDRYVIGDPIVSGRRIGRR